MALSVIPAGRGIRATNTWSAGERPELPRQGLMYLYPNGSLPLTALLSMMKSKKPPKARFSDYTKVFPSQAGDITAVFEIDHTTSFSAVAKDAGAKQFSVEVDSSTSLEIRPGHVVRLRSSTDYRVNVACSVVNVTDSGTTSFIDLKNLEAIVTSVTGKIGRAHV